MSGEVFQQVVGPKNGRRKLHQHEVPEIEGAAELVREPDAAPASFDDVSFFEKPEEQCKADLFESEPLCENVGRQGRIPHKASL